MNRINFNGKDGGGLHHLTPYQKKSRKRNIFPIDELKIQKDKIEKIKEMSDNIEIIDNPTGYLHKEGFYLYHSHKTFKKENQQLSVTDSIGGCGMQQFYSWTSIEDTQTAIELINTYLNTKDRGVGLIICQLGQNYFGKAFEKALIHHEFKISEEYSNFRHRLDGTYKQRVYSLHLKHNK